MYNSIGKNIYIYLPRCSCVGRTQTSTTQLFQTLLAQKISPSHIKSLHSSKYVTEKGPLTRQDTPVWSLNFLLWILHSKKPWWQNQEREGAVLFPPHMWSRRSSFITKSGQRSPHCFYSENRADVVWELGWWWRKGLKVFTWRLSLWSTLHRKMGQACLRGLVLRTQKAKRLGVLSSSSWIHWSSLDAGLIHTVFLSCKKDDFLCYRYSMLNICTLLHFSRKAQM